MTGRPALRAPGFAVCAYLIGGVPSSHLVAVRRGVDLRECGTGGVSASRVAQFVGVRPTVVAVVSDLAKGSALGLLAKRADDTATRCAVAVFGLAGHNWSPYLGGAGGRGVLPSLGFLAVQAPTGVRVIATGLLAGKSIGLAGLGGFAAYAALVPALRGAGRREASLAAAVVAPVFLKRVLGDQPGRAPRRASVGLYLRRLLLDEDEFSWFAWPAVREARDALRGSRATRSSVVPGVGAG